MLLPQLFPVTNTLPARAATDAAWSSPLPGALSPPRRAITGSASPGQPRRPFPVPRRPGDHHRRKNLPRITDPRRRHYRRRPMEDRAAQRRQRDAHDKRIGSHRRRHLPQIRCPRRHLPDQRPQRQDPPHTVQRPPGVRPERVRQRPDRDRRSRRRLRMGFSGPLAAPKVGMAIARSRDGAVRRAQAGFEWEPKSEPTR